MDHYISFLEDAMKAKDIAYSFSDSKRVLVAIRRFRGGPTIRVVFINNRSYVDVLETVYNTFASCQKVRACNIIEELDKPEHGFFECSNTDNKLVFMGGFQIIPEDSIIVECKVDFLCDYFLDIVPRKMAGIYYASIQPAKQELSAVYHL